MAEYIVACHLFELPYGKIFTTIPKFPYQRDEMVLLSLERFLIAGRWRPGDNGSCWLKLPGLLIELTERIPYRILGLVIPLDAQHWNSTIIPRTPLRGIIHRVRPMRYYHWFIVAIIILICAPLRAALYRYLRKG